MTEQRLSPAGAPPPTRQAARKQIDTTASHVAITNRSLKVRTIPELVALSKAKPGTLSYGTFSFPFAHFMEKLKQETGADIVRIPFRSGNEEVNAHPSLGRLGRDHFLLRHRHCIREGLQATMDS